MKARRYQLTKASAGIIKHGHPWIFREQLSSAAQVFRDGDLLKLVDAANIVVAYGTFEAEGAIAIRIIRRGPDAPDARWLVEALRAALARREPLTTRTNAMRLVNGESDGIPAVVADKFDDTIVVTSYSIGSDAYARFVARTLREHARNIIMKPAHRRRGEQGGESQPMRVLFGAMPDIVHVTEDNLRYAVDLAGQKTGTYLDLRGLRRAIATTPLAGARVLDLFAYTGMLGRAAEAAGATFVLHVDQSQRALDFARAHHTGASGIVRADIPPADIPRADIPPARHEFIVADIFDWLPTFDSAEQFDLVVVDPPAMTSRASQIPNVLAAYRKLYRAAREHVKPGGVVVAACCTSRIERALFHKTVRESLGDGFVMEREIPPELDHPVGFPQADYLKIGWWRKPAPP